MVDLEVGITIEAGLQEETITEVDHLEVEIIIDVGHLVGDIAEAGLMEGDVDVFDDY
jgi:hypothetical protein